MRNAKPIGKPDRPQARASHGAYAHSASALRIRAERVRRIVAAMRKQMPWLTAADVPAMKGWAELEVLSATIFSSLLKLGILNDENEPRRLLSEHRQFKLAMLQYESQLGMTPASRANLKLDDAGRAFDLDVSEPVAAQVIEIGAARKAHQVKTVEEAG
jgi:hypothetical protein